MHKPRLPITHIPKKLHVGKRLEHICKSEHSSHVSREKEHIKKRLAILSWFIAALGIFMSNIQYQCSEEAKQKRVRERMQQLDKRAEEDTQRMLSPHISPLDVHGKHR